MESDEPLRAKGKAGPITIAVAIAIVAVTGAYCYSVIKQCRTSEFNLAGLLMVKLQAECKPAQSPDPVREPIDPVALEKLATIDPINAKPNDFPCKLSWIFLGKYSNKYEKYQEPEFKYAGEKLTSGAIPSPSEKIIVLYEKNLLVTNYGLAAADKKCDGILDPPWKYRPETAKQFIAGKLVANKTVVINKVTRMPYEGAEPEYIWALVGPVR